MINAYFIIKLNPIRNLIRFCYAMRQVPLICSKPQRHTQSSRIFKSHVMWVKVAQLFNAYAVFVQTHPAYPQSHYACNLFVSHVRTFKQTPLGQYVTAWRSNNICDGDQSPPL